MSMIRNCLSGNLPFDLGQALVFTVIKKDHPGLFENGLSWNINVAMSSERITNGLR